MDTTEFTIKKIKLIKEATENTPVRVVATAYLDTVGYGYIFKEILKYIESANEEQLKRFEDALLEAKAKEDTK